MNSSFMKDLVQKLKKKKESMLLYLFDNDIEIQLGFYNLIHDYKHFNDIMVIIFCISPVKKSTLFTKFVKSFSNFQISDARCFVQKFTQTFFFFFVAMSTSIIKGPITWFYASKCFTPLSQTSIGF